MCLISFLWSSLSLLSEEQLIKELFFIRTPLHAAAFAGHVDCVQLLLAHNASVDDVDQSGSSALIMAAEKGRVEVVGMYSPCFSFPLLHYASVHLYKTVMKMSSLMQSVACVLNRSSAYWCQCEPQSDWPEGQYSTSSSLQ